MIGKKPKLLPLLLKKKPYVKEPNNKMQSKQNMVSQLLLWGYSFRQTSSIQSVLLYNGITRIKTRTKP